MSNPTVEERLSAVEVEIEKLKRQDRDIKEAEEPRGWKRIVGIFADNPEFEEAVREGKEWRDSFRPPDYERTS